jgi:hypothetical protein
LNLHASTAFSSQHRVPPTSVLLICSLKIRHSDITIGVERPTSRQVWPFGESIAPVMRRICSGTVIWLWFDTATHAQVPMADHCKMQLAEPASAIMTRTWSKALTQAAVDLW